MNRTSREDVEADDDDEDEDVLNAPVLVMHVANYS